jgi:tetratricopeptide (TPR) repeat protein
VKACLILTVIVVSIFISFDKCALSDDTGSSLYLKFDEASSLYSESKFEEAVEIYKEILSHNYESAELYYNLGNTYLKLGDLGEAILNYERAARLVPYDSDLKSNIKYANSLRNQPAITLTASSWLNRRISFVLSYFTADGLTILLSILYISALLILGIAVFRKNFVKFARKLVIIIAIVFMIFITILSFKIYHDEYVKSAIVLDKIVDARYEPLIEAPVHFRIYEGTKIVVLRTRGEWLQIQREDNKIGWIPSAACGII